VTRITGTLHEEQHTSRSVFLRMRDVSDHRGENQNTRFMFNTFSFENRVVYEIMWKNIVEPGRPQMKYGACELHAGYQRHNHIM